MIRGIEEKSKEVKGIVEGKIRIGVTVLKVTKASYKGDINHATDIKGNKIDSILYKNKLHEIISESANKESWFIHVSKEDNYPGAFMRSVPYFVLTPELEKIYGKRATQIKIAFVGDSIDEIMPSDNMKFSGGSLVCIGNGNIGFPGTARRYNPLTTAWDNDIPCLCSHNKHYPNGWAESGESTITTVHLDNIEGNREYPTGNKQVLVLGAWRDFISYDKDTKIFQLKSMKASCSGRYTLKFVTTESEGINLVTFEGGGMETLYQLQATLNSIKGIFGKISGIPLYLRVKMNKRKSKKFGTSVYPSVYLHLPYSVDEIMAMRLKRDMETTMLPVHAADTEIEPVDFILEEEENDNTD